MKVWTWTTILSSKGRVTISKRPLTAENDTFVAKIANMRLTKTFVAIFALAKTLPTSATLCSYMVLVFVVIIVDNIHAQGKIILTSIMIKSNLQD